MFAATFVQRFAHEEYVQYVGQRAFVEQRFEREYRHYQTKVQSTR